MCSEAGPGGMGTKRLKILQFYKKETHLPLPPPADAHANDNGPVNFLLYI